MCEKTSIDMDDDQVGLFHTDLDVDQDLISNLPESVFGYILSLLNTKAAVRTSVLSQSWRYRWICNVQLDDRETIEMNSCLVERGLLVALVSRNFTSFHFSCDSNLMTRLILRPNIDNLRWWEYRGDERFVLPQSLVNCNSLTSMDLGPSTLMVPSVHSFPNLTQLELDGVFVIAKMSDQTDTLIFRFPVLKKLFIKECKWPAKFVEFYAPQLTEFKSRAHPSRFRWNNSTIKIVGAELAKFVTFGHCLPGNFIMSGSTVDSAHLDCFRSDGQQVRKLLKELSTMRNLIANSGALEGIEQYPELALPKFHKLEQIDIIQYGCEFESLLELLHAAPSVKFISLPAMLYWDDYDYDDERSVPSCIISCLEEINFTWYHEEEAGILKFLLKNGMQLTRVSITSNDSKLSKDQLVKQLASFPRASARLTFVVS